MSVYSLIVGDLEPDMEIDVSNQLQLLTGALALNLVWWKPGALAPVTVPLQAINLATGQLKRVWSAGDSDVAGIHKARVAITCSNGEIASYPNDGSYIYWIVWTA